MTTTTTTMMTMMMQDEAAEEEVKVTNYVSAWEPRAACQSLHTQSPLCRFLARSASADGSSPLLFTLKGRDIMSGRKTPPFSFSGSSQEVLRKIKVAAKNQVMRSTHDVHDELTRKTLQGTSARLPDESRHRNRNAPITHLTRSLQASRYHVSHDHSRHQSTTLLRVTQIVTAS